MMRMLIYLKIVTRILCKTLTNVYLYKNKKYEHEKFT